MEQEKIDLFLKDIIEVMKSHNMSISHEDGHGAFIISEYHESLTKWLKEGHWNDTEYHFGFMSEEEVKEKLKILDAQNKREY